VGGIRPRNLCLGYLNDEAFIFQTVQSQMADVKSSKFISFLYNVGFEVSGFCGSEVATCLFGLARMKDGVITHGNVDLYRRNRLDLKIG
jgi:hypothetical protein